VIENGQFRVSLPAGNYRLEFTAVPAPPKGTPKNAKYRNEVGIPETPELIPAKYNVRSELTWDLLEGSNTRTFELTSR
jgi:hypothetical protein